ncbi:MAG: delta-60 repeat domain-containing protein [Dokdonella sp.]
MSLAICKITLSQRLLAPVLFFTCAVARAQYPAPLPMPDLTLRSNGVVRALARQPDGSVIIGGEFTEFAGVPRSNLARLLPDGSLDPVWTASTDGRVNALAVGNGAVYVGGFFINANGVPKYSLAKFAGSGEGALDPDWFPYPNYTVDALAVDPDGSVYAGGGFTQIGNQPHNHIVKIAGTGLGIADPTWNPSASGDVETIVPDGHGYLYVGGRFNSIGGQTRSRIAKLEKSGDADPNWNPRALNGSVYSISLDDNGNVYAGGGFTNIGGQPRSKIARLSTSGTGLADPVWNPSANETVVSIVVDGNNAVYAGGYFNTIGGQIRNSVAKLSQAGTGAADAAWDASADGYLNALVLGNGGRLYMGGAFSRVAGAARRGIAAISADGTPAGAVDASLPGSVFALAKQHDGGLIVGGRFFTTGDQLRTNLLRVRPDGTLDPDWAPSLTLTNFAVDARANSVAVDGNDDVYVGGEFDQANGLARAFIAKIAGHGAGSIDPTWDPSADSEVLTVALDGKGSIYAGGNFGNLGGLPRNYVAKISAIGAGMVDPTWDPSADSTVAVIRTEAAGAVYAGGYFSQIGGETRVGIAKLSAEGVGAADAEWNADSDDAINDIELDGDTVFVGGYFSTIGGTAHPCVAKLASTTGAADAQWNSSTQTLCGAAYGMAVDGKGSIYVGGVMERFGETVVNGLAKLSTSGAGDPDPSWNPGVNEGVNFTQGFWTMLRDDAGTLYIGGGFTQVGGEARNGFAALPTTTAPDRIFVDGFDAAR